jgi:hypothetical protein
LQQLQQHWAWFGNLLAKRSWAFYVYYNFHFFHAGSSNLFHQLHRTGTGPFCNAVLLLSCRAVKNIPKQFSLAMLPERDTWNPFKNSRVSPGSLINPPNTCCLFAHSGIAPSRGEFTKSGKKKKKKKRRKRKRGRTLTVRELIARAEFRKIHALPLWRKAVLSCEELSRPESCGGNTERKEAEARVGEKELGVDKKRNSACPIINFFFFFLSVSRAEGKGGGGGEDKRSLPYSMLHRYRWRAYYLGR